MTTINIFGSGGHARVIMEIIEAQGDEAGFLYDDAPHCEEIYGHPVYKTGDVAVTGPLIVGIGGNAIRKKIVEKLQCPFWQAVHPSAIVSPTAKIGEGSVVMQGAILQACVSVGRHSIINTGASVDHECVLDDYVHLSPHSTLCGNVRVGVGTWIGAGATVIQGVSIGRWSVIGAGTVVTRDIPDGVVAVGNKCHIIKETNMHLLKDVIGGGKNADLTLVEARKVRVPAVPVNILVTSAGKRVCLVREFQEAAAAYLLGAKVFTTEMNPDLSPAAAISDGCFRMPGVTDESYIDILFRICRDNHIGLVVPTIDTELQVLSENKRRFEAIGCNLLISQVDFVRTCRDKRNTGAYLQRCGIRVPRQIDKYHPAFPLFAKPYDGSLSKDLHVIRKPEELTPDILDHPKLMFMEYIDKREYREFTVDMYYGRDNKVKGIVPRERMEVRAGEINKGVTRKNYLLDLLKERMKHLSGVVGCICIQLFYRESDRDVVGIEINPRFGGGYPLSYAAGANFPAMAIREYLCGEHLDYDETWKEQTLMLRYDEAVFTYDADV